MRSSKCVVMVAAVPATKDPDLAEVERELKEWWSERSKSRSAFEPPEKIFRVWQPDLIWEIGQKWPVAPGGQQYDATIAHISMIELRQEFGPILQFYEIIGFPAAKTETRKEGRVLKAMLRSDHVIRAESTVIQTAWLSELRERELGNLGRAEDDPIICEACETRNDSDATFCKACGASLATEDAAGDPGGESGDETGTAGGSGTPPDAEPEDPSAPQFVPGQPPKIPPTSSDGGTTTTS